MPRFSVIIPVYNRPDEVKELLESLFHQSYKDFEVVIVEDGSLEKCDHIVQQYAEKLDISYYFKPNSGPGSTRNYGVEKAKSNYYIFFDSDCIIPQDYLKIVSNYLNEHPVECYGGPDRSHPSFTPIQKAISYTMTSLFTTGGIRGGKKKMTRFYPRSFNMGFSDKVFNTTKGYAPLRFGEDLDLSMRIEKLGFNPVLIPDAYVYHKRRTSFLKFYKQIFNSGIARVNLGKIHPGSLKITHILPLGFVFFSISSVILTFMHYACIIPLLVYLLLIFIDAGIKNKSLLIGYLSVIALFVQMYAYGLGFLKSFFYRVILHKPIFSAYDKTFYK